MLFSSSDRLQGIRQSEWESREFTKVRKLLNEAIVLETPYYDITRVNADEDDDEEGAIQVRSAVSLPLCCSGGADGDRCCIKGCRTSKSICLSKMPFLKFSISKKLVCYVL